MPGVLRVVASQLVARFPYGMISIGMLVFVVKQTNSYAAAGAVLGAMSLGNALAGALTSRLLGNWGIRRMVMGTAVICSAAISAMALIPMSVPALVGLGLIAGAAYPPVQAAVRTLYPKLVPEKELGPLYSVDASAQELIWIAGPVLVTFVSIQVSAVLGVMLSVIFFLGGGLWFITTKQVRELEIPRNESRYGAVLGRPIVLINSLISITFIAAFTSAEAGVIAIFGDGNAASGWVLGVWAMGSLVGGLALGHLAISPWSLSRRMVIVIVGLSAALVSHDFWWLCLTLFISGFGVAPILALLYSTVSATIAFSETPEAFGWIGTGQLVGAAVGSAVAGVAIDHFGSGAGLTCSLLFTIVTMVFAISTRRWMPDLRNRSLATSHVGE
jgi:MFS family permease